MEDDPDVRIVLHHLHETVTHRGLDRLMRELVQRVWRADLDRQEPALGDTASLLGWMCAENVKQLLHRALTDPNTALEGVKATLTQGSLLVEVDGYRLRVIKAPASSALSPSWRTDFAWTPSRPLRFEMAQNNALVYPAPAAHSELEPMLSATEVGLVRNAWDLHNHFVIWAGVTGSPPRTAGWLATPTADASVFLAIEPLWLDAEAGPGVVSPASPQPSPGPEPALTIKLRQRPASGTT